MKKKNIIFSLIITLLLASCGEVVNEFSNHVCRISLMDTEVTQLTALDNAIKGNNIFVRLSCDNMQGEYYVVKAVSADGNVEKTARVWNKRTSCVLGVDNPSGVIIGNSSMKSDNPYIYDRVCPNCYANGQSLSGKVLFDDNGMTVTCNKCHRKYDLLNGGLVVAGESGQKLFRYYGFNGNNSFVISNPR